MSDRPKSADLTPGTRLRFTGPGRAGIDDVVVLARRKDPAQHVVTRPFHPGWWCEDFGGLADFVIDDPRSLWEILPFPAPGLADAPAAPAATQSASPPLSGLHANESERR